MGWNAQEGLIPVQAEHITLERPRTSRSQTIEVHVPTASEPFVPERSVREIDLAARPSRSFLYMIAATVSRLLVYEDKYRWYRGQGYGRALARAKAWWQAKATPCPLASGRIPPEI